MLLAADVGGTKTLLGLFEPAAPRPRQVASHSYATGEFKSFAAILDAFAADSGTPLTQVSAAAAGVAGPVVRNTAALTNIGWRITAAELGAHLRTARVRLLNDLEAMATSVEALEQDEFAILQAGVADPTGNAAVIAAGTGLGSAHLHRSNGRLRAAPSEAGHADFAARTDREIDLLRMLRSRFGRAEVEQVLSGPGLVNLYHLTHADQPCSAHIDADASDAPADVSQAAMDGTCAHCIEALDMFVAAYGAEAGNLALRAVATGGMFIGGGIAPKILPALQTGQFMRCFLDKAPMHDLLTRIAVKVILNQEAGLLGAAIAADALVRS
jgi:glucokinase